MGCSAEQGAALLQLVLYSVDMCVQRGQRQLVASAAGLLHKAGRYIGGGRSLPVKLRPVASVVVFALATVLAHFVILAVAIFAWMCWRSIWWFIWRFIWQFIWRFIRERGG